MKTVPKSARPALVNVHDAKTQLSRLLARVEAGEEILIARSGRAVARLAPLDSRATERVLGRDAGTFTVPEDFDAPLPDEILREFES